MKYENTKTGAILVTPSVIHAKDWKLMRPPKAEVNKSKKKVSKSKSSKGA